MARVSPAPIVVVLAVVVFVVQCGLLFGYTMDDAFISFRYARNLARGEGLVYNPGQSPVEGYSSFLWTILFVPVIAAGWDPELVSKILGILCGLGVLGVTVLLSRRLSRDSVFRCMAPLLVGGSPVMAMQAITGLETHLFGLLLAAGVWLTIREWEERRRFPLSAFAFIGCALTRPEGAALFAVSLVAAATVGWTGARTRKPGFSSGGWLVLSVLLFGAVYGTYTVWRLAYFGSLVPNTFYAKTAGLRQLGEGWKYLRDFSGMHGGLLLYLMGFIALVLRWQDGAVRYLAAVGACFLGTVVYEGGDWMPLFRLLAPALPILFLLSQEGVRELHAAAGGWLAGRGAPYGRARILTGGILTALLVSALVPLPAKAREAMERQELYENAHRRSARWLKANTPPGESIALSDIGQFGYYSDLPVIDLVGLTNPEIARAEGLLHEKKADAGVVLSRRPAHVVIVCHREGGEWKNRGFPVETALLASDEFRQKYGLQALVYYKEDYSYWIFSRKDLRGLHS